MKIAVVASKFNENIVQKLLDGAQQAFEEFVIDDGRLDFEVFWVPGAFEIPVMCKKLLDTGVYDALVALGCVIKGQTDHYDHVCRTCADNVAQLARKSGVPIIFEVLMCVTIEQALERAGGKMGNRGYDAAQYALEMAETFAKMAS
jgi:6,7-dimethyl-8-ribityllumazine synthase